MIFQKIEKIKIFLKENIIGTKYEWESHFQNILYLFDKNLKELNPDSFLDVGCGNGKRTIRTIEYFDIAIVKTYGIDIEEKHICECGEYFNAEKINLEEECFPYSNESFDLVMCNQVLEHLKYYDQVISEIIRVTRNRGYIILGIPNLAHLINRAYLLFGIQPMCIDIDSTHIRGFTHREFLKKLKTIEEVRVIDYTGSLMYPLPYFIAEKLSKYFVGFSGYTCYLLQKI